MRRKHAVAGGLLAVAAIVAGCGSGAAATSTVPRQSGTVAITTITAAASSGSGAASSEPTLAISAAPISTAPVPSGALTVTTLGDSLTEGQGDDGGPGYPGRLQTLIAPLRPGSKVVNFGHSGWSSTDLINGQDGLPSELTQSIDAKANVALVWIGSNDLWNLYEYGPEPMTADAEAADLQAYETNMDKILRDLAAHGATIFVALLDDQSKRPVVADPPNQVEPAFPNTTKADLALMSAHVKAYNQIITQMAARYGATTVSFYGSPIFTNPATLYDDGNHPNSAGYDAVAQVWFAAVAPRLRLG
jgi:lysophospholipase L1-like esterase